MQSVPAAARRVKQWVKKRTSREAFTFHYLSKLPEFFLHRQIEQVAFLYSFRNLSHMSTKHYSFCSQAQHDVYKIFIELVQPASYSINLLVHVDFDKLHSHRTSEFLNSIKKSTFDLLNIFIWLVIGHDTVWLL